MRKVRIFVTGGAGYIGSHFVKNCYESTQRSFDPEILVYDDLSKGLKSNVLYGDLLVGSLDDREFLRKTLVNFQPDVVVHFAASIQVGESEQKPWKYFKNNTDNTLNLFRLMEELEIPRLIFSSTAAVYGNNHEEKFLVEDDDCDPMSVYGKSKAIPDQILLRCGSQLPFHFVTFRYFNVCGADPLGRIGQESKNATHLITRAIEVALGRIESLPIYGNDYNTPDGTCIRDYVHVEDLAGAHILGMECLLEHPQSHVFNLGSGIGYSVKEVIQTVNSIAGHEIAVELNARRAGDPAFLVANSQKAETLLNWKRRYDLKQMISHAYTFQKGM